MSTKSAVRPHVPFRYIGIPFLGLVLVSWGKILLQLQTGLSLLVDLDIIQNLLYNAHAMISTRAGFKDFQLQRLMRDRLRKKSGRRTRARACRIESLLHKERHRRNQFYFGPIRAALVGVLIGKAVYELSVRPNSVELLLDVAQNLLYTWFPVMGTYSWRIEHHSMLTGEPLSRLMRRHCVWLFTVPWVLLVIISGVRETLVVACGPINSQGILDVLQNLLYTYQPGIGIMGWMMAKWPEGLRKPFYRVIFSWYRNGRPWLNDGPKSTVG